MIKEASINIKQDGSWDFSITAEPAPIDDFKKQYQDDPCIKLLDELVIYLLNKQKS